MLRRPLRGSYRAPTSKDRRMKPKTFKRWCEDNGRRSVGCANYAEFARNAADYETFRERAILQAKISAHSSKLAQAATLEREAATLPYAVRNLNLPPIDGGDDGTS